MELNMFIAKLSESYGYIIEGKGQEDEGIFAMFGNVV